METQYKNEVIEIYEKAGIKLTEAELTQIEYADFGLDNIREKGLNLLIYVNNDRYCAKEMVLLPNQICPEHEHPYIKELELEGKQETFRCRWGKVILFVEGTSEKDEISAELSGINSEYYTATKKIELLPGEQYTIDPGIKHWFKAGDEGAVVSEFSSPSYDEYDVFTNPEINRNAQDR